MRKGATLERNIDKILKYLDAQGIHGHKNHAKKLMDGTCIEGEPFDYEVFSPAKMFCFDAKECESDAWPLSKAKLSQVNNLLQCERVGAEAFFLVYFIKKNKIVRFSASLVKNSLGVKHSLSPDEGVDFDWQIFLK